MFSYDIDAMSELEPHHRDDDHKCLNFTVETADDVLRIKGSLGAITVVANLLAILLILITKKYKDITFRLVIYLMITDILQAVAMCLALTPVEVVNEENAASVRNGSDWNRFCAATGFLLMTTMWMGNLVIVYIVVHLLVLGWRLHRAQVGVENNAAQQKNSFSIKTETIRLLVLIIVPLAIGIIPFFLPHEMYGISGLWCWIKMLYDSCGDLNEETLIVAFVFFYGPLVLIVLFSFISMMVTIVFVCYGAVRRHGRTKVDQHQRRMKEVIIVLVYPCLYCTVCLLLLSNRIYSLSHSKEKPYKPLWIAHTVADPVRVLLPAVAFLLHPYVWKDLCTKTRSRLRMQSTADNEPDTPGQYSGVVNGGDRMEDKLLNTHVDYGNKRNYGGCHDVDDKNMSFVVESK